MVSALLIDFVCFSPIFFSILLYCLYFGNHFPGQGQVNVQMVYSTVSQFLPYFWLHLLSVYGVGGV